MLWDKNALLQTASFKLSRVRRMLSIFLKIISLTRLTAKYQIVGSRIVRHVCNILITDNSFPATPRNVRFSAHSFENLSCCSYTSNLVYAIECTLCGIIYVGEAKGQLRSRMNGHRFQINHGGNQLLYKHFNLPDHSILSMKARILEKIYFSSHKQP